MRYISTRDKNSSVSAQRAILSGISPDGGLYVPEEFPRFTAGAIKAMVDMDYCGRAFEVCRAFLPDFDSERLRGFIGRSYESFSHPRVAPLRRLDDGFYVCELFHGPTSAFKDVALQLLPYLMTESARMLGDAHDILILTATSGDTGKAALEGFRDVDGTAVTVFYPHGGVSDIQRLQMSTQQGGNVRVVAVRGNFDDTQAGVKRIFTDPDIKERLERRGVALSSANSINFGRLLPQVAYYFSSYVDLVRDGVIKLGDDLDFAVPTGNFGNILAGYYAKRCGLPVGRLICASNKNNILTDFFMTGVYDTRRPFYLTSSPSMDILVSSNLERLLFELLGRDDAGVRALMESLTCEGSYRILSNAQREAACFVGGFCPEESVPGAIADMYARCGYVMDPHTAVGCHVARELKGSGVTVLMGTASPYKFCGAVLGALGRDVPKEPFDALRALYDISGAPVPEGLGSLEGRPERFTEVVDVADMVASVL